MRDLRCRFCEAPLSNSFIDLGTSPVANSYIDPVDSLRMEPFFALHAFVCRECFLVQLPLTETREHYLQRRLRLFLLLLGISARPLPRLCRGDGRPLRLRRALAGDRGRQQRRLPVAVSSRRAACRCSASSPRATSPRRRSPPASRAGSRFFGVETATALKAEGFAPDLMLGNNVLAHVPDINDFVGGFKVLLGPTGRRRRIEFPHLLRMMHENYYDTDLPRALLLPLVLQRREDLRRARADAVRRRGDHAAGRHPAHLRPPRRRRDPPGRPAGRRAARPRDRRRRSPRCRATAPSPSRSRRTKRDLLRFLMEAKEAGKTVVGYGAPGQGQRRC